MKRIKSYFQILNFDLFVKMILYYGMTCLKNKNQ